MPGIPILCGHSNLSDGGYLALYQTLQDIAMYIVDVY